MQNLWKTSYILTKLFNTAATKGAFQASRSIKSSLEHFRINMPKINALCNPGIKKRHWDMMNEKVRNFPDIGLPNFLLSSMKIY